MQSDMFARAPDTGGAAGPAIGADEAAALRAQAAIVLPPMPGTAPRDLDFADIKGHESAKRALEIALTGRHSILLLGPLGCGKSMLLRAAFALNLHLRGGLNDEDDIDRDGFPRDQLERLLDRGDAMVVATATDPAKLGARLLDRFAIAVDLQRVSAADLLLPPPAEDSAAVRQRIAAAAPVDPLRAKLDPGPVKLLRDACDAMNLSARAYHHLVAVAYTIARLDAAGGIGRIHIAEALSYLPRGDAKPARPLG